MVQNGPPAVSGQSGPQTDAYGGNPQCPFMVLDRQRLPRRRTQLPGHDPLLRWQRDIEQIRQIPPATDVRRLFFYRVIRTVRRDSTFLLQNRFYEAPPYLAGQRIETRFD